MKKKKKKKNKKLKIKIYFCFFFNDPAPPEFYTNLNTLSLHDALPISILTLTACQSTPKWVKTGVYTGSDAKAFYSTGEVMGIRNEPLAWDVAENRARAQMVKIL